MDAPVVANKTTQSLAVDQPMTDCDEPLFPEFGIICVNFHIEFGVIYPVFHGVHVGVIVQNFYIFPKCSQGTKSL